MNRRSFFKVVTGYVAGVFATSVEGKKRPGTRLATQGDFQKALNEVVEEKLKCDGLNGTLCPRRKFSNYTYDSCCQWPIYCKRKGWIDARVYGVTGYDDTKAIQEAIDLAKDGGAVYPKGTYNIKSVIKV